MTVKQLIAKLKLYPQNLQVMYSAHDNSVWEISGDVHSVFLYNKLDNPCPDYLQGEDRDWYDSGPNRAIVLRG